MMKLEKLYELRKFASMLMDGLDPVTKKSYLEDTILNAPEVKKYNKEICGLIDELILSRSHSTSVKEKRIPFSLLKSDMDEFTYESEAISISALCFKLNQLVLPGMKRLKATDVTNGLVRLGYLRINDECNSSKMPTQKGLELGIILEKKNNSFGNTYHVNLYNTEAQKFVVLNLNEILNY